MNVTHIGLRPVQGYCIYWALVESTFCNSMVIGVKGTLVLSGPGSLEC